MLMCHFDYVHYESEDGILFLFLCGRGRVGGNLWCFWVYLYEGDWWWSEERVNEGRKDGFDDLTIWWIDDLMNWEIVCFVSVGKGTGAGISARLQDCRVAGLQSQICLRALYTFVVEDGENQPDGYECMK